MTTRTAPAATLRLGRAAVLFAALGLSACPTNLGDAECASNDNCPDGRVCLDGVCEVSAAPDAGALSCVIDSDCPSGSCMNGTCAGGDIYIGDGDTTGDGDGDVVDGDGTARVEPTDLFVDFGSPVLAVGIERVVSVQNLGPGAFEVLSVQAGAGTSLEFAISIDGTLPVQLLPDERLEVTVTYTLADGEEDTGTLQIVTDAIGCSPDCGSPSLIEVDLFSEFKGARDLELSPETHDFGFTPVGDSSASIPLLLTNDGTLDKVLTIDTLAVTGDDGDFDLPLPTPPVYLAPGESYEVPVSYAPTSMSSNHSVTVTATANSDTPERRELSASFTGTTQPPNALVFDPPELVFPELATGQVAQLQSVLKNVGAVPIQVTSLDLGPQNEPHFSFTTFPQLPYTLPPDPNIVITVYVDYTAQSNGQAVNAIAAQNNQESGDVPTLGLRGASYVPPGGPIVDIVTGPETTIDSDCGCAATSSNGQNVPAANVDIEYRAPNGSTCAKPQDPTCSSGQGTCACNNLNSYGTVYWDAARTETVRNETWVIDEQVHHEGTGTDGLFDVLSRLTDNCLAAPGSTDYSTNHACCQWVDCETYAQACYDFGGENNSPVCAVECQYHASQATSQDCLKRGPSAIRTTVHIYGAEGFDETRHFCRILSTSGQVEKYVTLKREAGYFTIDSVAPGVTEVSAGQPCPAP